MAEKKPLRTFEVALPRHDVEVYTVRASSMAEALRIARQLRAECYDGFDVVAGSATAVIEVDDEV